MGKRVWRVLVNVYRVTVSQDEKVLEICCTTH